MARPIRIEYPNAWYHVMNRDQRGDDIFSDKYDFEMFLEVFRDSSELFGCCEAKVAVRTTKNVPPPLKKTGKS